MKHLLLFALSLTTAVSFSQLYVTPNTTTNTDSYVYVSNEILFVEQDVNLVVNTNNAATEASIYLRNDGQLIQGASASNNAGTGLLSVYQNAPDDDAWDYTYWCSPVGNPAGAAGSTNFGIGRVYDVQTVTQSTVSLTTGAYNGIISPMTISTRWLYKHDTPGTEAEAHYTAIGTGNNVPAGFGFIMKGLGTTNHDQNYDFRGRPNNGSFSIPVGTGFDVNGNPYWTLTGNPYPSALDLAMVVNNNAMVNSIRFWEQDRTINSHYYSAARFGYGSWVPAGGAAGTYTAATISRWDSSGNTYPGGTSSGLSIQRRYAPIGQGFLIVGDGVTGGNATIDNSMRVFVKEGAANLSEFRNPEDNGSAVANNEDSDSGAVIIGDDNSDNPIYQEGYWPQIRLVTVFGDSHSREMVLLFNEDSTDGYDHGMDALHPMDASSESYFPIGEDYNRLKYVIETVPFEMSKQIPFAVTLDRQYKVLIESIEVINFYEHAFIWDRVENTYQEITYGQEAGFILPAGEYDNRFFIVFRGERAAIENSDGTIETNKILASVDFFQNNPAKQLEVTNPEGYNIVTAQFFDMAGKLVFNQANVGDNKKFTFPTGNLSDGVYLVKLTTDSNVAIDYKMIIHNK